MPDGLAVLDRSTTTASTRTLVPIEAHLLGNRSNDMKTDSLGRIWVGTMAYDRTPDAGGLYRVDGGQVQPAVAPLTISNGPAIDEANARLYIADTIRMIVDVFDFDVASGALSARRAFLDFAEEQIWPDGMTIDDEGHFWVALGRSGAVHRYRPDGTLDGMVELPVSNPTSIAFGGDGGKELYITTSWYDLTRAQRETQPLAGAIFRCTPGVGGPGALRAQPLPILIPADFHRHQTGSRPRRGP
jgi:sugar lactone lactonase YvrE